MRRDNRTGAICDLYSAAIKRGEDQAAIVAELASLYDVQRPAIFKALRRGGVLPPYAPRVAGGQGRPIGGGTPGYTAARRAKSIEHSFSAIPTPTDRDPCEWCGTRHDIGCRHSSKGRLSVW